MSERVKATILLVEDDKVQAAVAKDILEGRGFKVFYVRDGKSAIRIAKTQDIDLILLDLILPDVDGNEVARWLKLNDDTKGIPIIVLTVKGTTVEKVLGLEAGADDYLPKPYNEVELNARIYACLRTKALQDELRMKNRQMEEILLKVETLTITDDLTELFNRRHFEASLEKEYRRADRLNSKLSCMLMDIDNFRKVAEAFGRDAADSLLRQSARLLKSCVRGIDMIARWGSQEFAIYLPEASESDAESVGARILEVVSSHDFPGITERVTLSIGIAGIPDASIDSTEKLIREADIALYEARAKGGNKVELA
ncbi:MAG TPA: diguanylate cyclase [Thermodesulfovibrionales bacterium]|nr:diguanylate cyclase [Thermodesulfovibrionales bacterium]